MTARYLERTVAAAALAAVVVFVAVGIQRSIWLDEANCIQISRGGVSGIASGLRHDNNFPLYYVLLSVWMRLFGDSEVALRSLSAAAYVAASAVAALLAGQVAKDGRASWYGAFFYLSSPLAIVQAQNVRPYALLGLLAGLSALVFLRLFIERHWSWGTAGLFFVVNGAGILTHVWFGFAMAAQFLALLVLNRGQLRRFVACAAAACVPFAALWGRSFLEQLRNGATDWMPPFRPGMAVTALLEFYGFFPGMVLYGLTAGALVMAGAAVRKRLFQENTVSSMAVVVGASLVLGLSVSLARPVYWPGRYGIIALAPLAALLGASLPSILPRAALPVLCLLLLGYDVTVQVKERNLVREAELPPGQSDQVTAGFLLRHAAPGDAVVFTSLSRPAADYYFRRAGARDRFVEASFPAEVLLHPGWSDPTVPPGRRAPLESEAAETAGRIASVAAGGRRVWLYDVGNEVSEVLKRRLDASLALRREYPLQGPYHRRIVEYGAALR